MLMIIIINLAILGFDVLYDSQTMRKFITNVAPNFSVHYGKEIHPDILRIDLIFIGIYITELLIRWGIAIFRKTYHRWFFYPFVHWYDTLGCIPIAGFHGLRLLRVFVILKRLHRMGWLNWNQNFIYLTIKKYSAILTEEVSDRVVCHILNNMQHELRQGTPIFNTIIKEAIAPQTDVLSIWIVNRLRDWATHSFDPRKDKVREQIRNYVQEAILRNVELQRMTKTPGVGHWAREKLEVVVADMVFDVGEQMMNFFRSEHSPEAIREIQHVVIQSLSNHTELNSVIEDILYSSLEIIKQQVRIQQWKLAEQGERQSYDQSFSEIRMTSASLD
ncbi:MAG: hypothetical protein V4629_06010 [Pseudomonadota bacterium]